MIIRLGTRGSLLALTQSGHVADALRSLGHDVELVTVRTEGDVNRQPLSQLGGIGVFAAALRTDLLAGHVDIAVHSYKDLPTAGVSGLVVAAIPSREDPCDVLVVRAGGAGDVPILGIAGLVTRADGLAGQPQGARVGTGSPRRAAQLLAARPDVEIVDIRGNVDTRLGYVASGELDAVVLAAAGLRRLGRLGDDAHALDIWPAPAQGALAVECRSSDEALRAILADLDDPQTRFAATAERAVLARLGAGCAAPVAALSSFEGADYLLRAAVLSPSGEDRVDATAAVRWAEADAAAIGAALADDLIALGAGRITDLGATAPSKLESLHDA